MIYIALVISALIVYLWQAKMYSQKSLEDLKYNVSLSAEEVFEDEDIFMYEEILNAKRLPLPYVKIDTQLPDGIKFRLYESADGGKTKKDRLAQNIRSIFVLRARQSIRRRWRINCKTRGVYSLQNVVAVSNDILGLNTMSKAIEIEQGKHNRVVVLPKAVDLDRYFTASLYHSGDVIISRSLLSDPLLKCGTREYTSADPMNRINWMSTASHGHLMVNVEEYTQRHQFNIVMNMQSRSIERNPAMPAVPEFIEAVITVAASILDLVSADNIPVRLIANVPPESVGEKLEADSEDEIGSKLLLTDAYQGKRDTINALRLLASLPLDISIPTEKMLDHILEHPYYYSAGGNIVVISPFVDERMINFYDEMKRAGVDVIFFITTTHDNAINVPERVPVYFKSYFN